MPGAFALPVPVRAFVQRAPLQITRYNITRQSFHTQHCQRFSESTRQSIEGREDALTQEMDKQIKTPWHREGSSAPPVSLLKSVNDMTKGKLLTTPSRLLKLILPLTTRDEDPNDKDIEPLALLVHPQQPLSYLERLIQSELPTIRTNKGEEKIPYVHFKAEDSQQDQVELRKRADEAERTREKEQEDEDDGLEEMKFDGKIEKTGILDRKSRKEAAHLRGGPGEGGVESYSGFGREMPDSMKAKDRKFVRWSASTEIGDFIRDAARGKEFAVEIEGAAREIRVGVPSFNDRTHYLRQRLRKVARKILTMADIKKECDTAAHKSAQRYAVAGFGALAGWWYVVYLLTFKTELGWDTMEPVTYLVGLSTLMAGYGWFLYHNRDVSYRAAMNMTISKKQTALYHKHGFDAQKWDALIEEGNAIRKEIKAVAEAYDVEWDEVQEEGGKTVATALKKERDKQKGNDKDGKKKDDDDDGDD